MSTRKSVKLIDHAYFDNLEGCKCSLRTMRGIGDKAD
jgi:hypothetical protein